MVAVNDKGWKAIQAKLKELAQTSITVGVQGQQAAEQKKGEDGSAPITLVEVATVHEFGSKDGRIPQRSYIRSTVKEKAATIADLRKRATIAALDPNRSIGDMRKAVNVIGVYAQGAIRKKIVDIQSPPLAESTKKRKARTLSGKKKASFVAGSGNPLVDTGQLKSGITYRVNRKGSTS